MVGAKRGKDGDVKRMGRGRGIMLGNEKLSSVGLDIKSRAEELDLNAL